MATKIITCKYCGNQELIRLAEGERFRLVCSACGAANKDVEIVQPPVQQSIQPPLQPQRQPEQSKIQPAIPQSRSDEKKYRDKNRKDYKNKKSSRKRKYEKSGKSKKRKSTVKYWFEKVKDEIEDIFD